MADTKTPQRDLFAEMRDEVADELQDCESLIKKVIERHADNGSHLKPSVATFPLYSALLNILKLQGHLSDLKALSLRQIAAKHQK